MKQQNQGVAALLPAPRNKHVLISTLTTDEAAFQPRHDGLQMRHVETLRDVLRGGQPLERMAVWEDPETKALIVADGHHRLAAYQLEWPGAKAPVAVYRCDQETATYLSMIDNAKSRLGLSYDERADRAWRMTCQSTPLSAKQVAGLCGIGNRTVKTMRKALKEIGSEGELPESWRDAQAQWKGQNIERANLTDDERAALMEQYLQRADGAFGSQLADLFKRWPDAGDELVERCAGRRFVERFMDRHGAVEIAATQEAKGILAARMADEFTPEEIEEIAQEAKRGPMF